MLQGLNDACRHCDAFVRVSVKLGVAIGFELPVLVGPAHLVDTVAQVLFYEHAVLFAHHIIDLHVLLCPDVEHIVDRIIIALGSINDGAVREDDLYDLVGAVAYVVGGFVQVDVVRAIGICRGVFGVIIDVAALNMDKDIGTRVRTLYRAASEVHVAPVVAHFDIGLYIPGFTDTVALNIQL